MQWDKLLSRTRVRILIDGKPQTSPAAGPQGIVDVRTEFERDFDRLIFSSAVRRLQDKTQVFPLDPSDAIRTRLTHSLEVSTIARGMAQVVAKNLVDAKKLQPEEARDVITIAQSVGLVHDLGNPPFGHAGEKAIQQWFERRKSETKEGEPFQHLERFHNHAIVQDFLKFEGNAQTVRLLSHLQLLADDHGMNLTAATLCATLKYTARSDEVVDEKTDHRRSKPGYNVAENDVVSAIRKETGVPRFSRHPISCITEAADDCVYSIVDFEDAIRKQVITWQEALVRLPDIAEEEGGEGGRKFVKSVMDEAQKYIDEKSQLAGVSLKETAKEDAYVQSFRTFAASHIVHGTGSAFANRYDHIMDGTYSGELVLEDRNSSLLVGSLKTLGQKFIYATRPNLELELRGRHIIHSLMNLFWEGIASYNTAKKEPEKTKKFAGKAWGLISANYRSVFERSLQQAESRAHDLEVPIEVYTQYLKLLLLTDYISGMTDSYACRLHGELGL